MSEITKALVRFQKSAPAIVKNKDVNAGARRYKYADLAEIMNAIQPVLSENGLFLTQSFDTNGVVYLVTKVMHEAGESIESRLPLPIDGLKPQDVGSAITYYRRYSITAILGLAADDDDGEAAQKAGATHGRHAPATASSELTRQLSASVEHEARTAVDLGPAVKPQHASDPRFAAYLKDTPNGKAWKVTAIKDGADPNVPGIRDFVRDLEAQTELDELKGFLKDNEALLDACAEALPNWYFGKQGSDVPGIEKRISDKKQELSARSAEFNPSRVLA